MKLLEQAKENTGGEIESTANCCGNLHSAEGKSAGRAAKLFVIIRRSPH
jgi:hypothetical protein